MRHTSSRRRSESVRGIGYRPPGKKSTEIFDRIDEENGVECPVCHVKIKVGRGGKLVKHAPGGSKVQEQYGRPACWGGGPDSDPVVDPDPQPDKYTVTPVLRPNWQRDRHMGGMYTGHGTVRLYEVSVQRWGYIKPSSGRAGRWAHTPKSQISRSDVAQVACDGNQNGVSVAWCFACKREDMPGCEHIIAVLKHIRSEVEHGIEWVPWSTGEIEVQVVRAAKPAPHNTEPDRLFMWSNLRNRLRIGDRLWVPWPVDEAHPWNDATEAEVQVTGLGSCGQETRVHKILKKVEESATSS